MNSPLNVTSLFRLTMRSALHKKLSRNSNLPTLVAFYHNSPVVQPNRSNYANLTQDDINFFRSLLGSRCLTDETDVSTYNVDWLNIYKGIFFT